MLLKHLVGILALPVTVMLILPIIFARTFHYVPFWGLESLAATVSLIIGLFLMGSGLILLFSTIFLFISKGRGTLAPWSPTNNLVTTGVYGYIRNPMMAGVFFVLIGESTLVGSIPLTIYTIAFILTNSIYIPLIEEPKLTEKFGKKYLIYNEKVPRWIPRASRKLRMRK